MVPVGSIVDASKGAVRLGATLPSGRTQTGRFGGGRFKVRQRKGGYVDLYLKGDACSRPTAQDSVVAETAARKRSGRRLWGKDKGGKFRTHGRSSHATVRGTRWFVKDTCKGTFTRVTEGAVVVRDKVRGKQIVLEKGESYLARHRQ